MAAPNLSRDPLEPLPLLEGKHTDKTINDSLLEHVWRGAGKGWWALFSCALSALSLLVIAISWTLYHVIDENSPLYQITADDLAELKAALAVVVSGYDVVAAQTILGRKAYEYDEIRFGHRYADIIGTSEDGRLRIDYGRFHETLEG